MAESREACDVFVSHSATESAVAAEVARACRASGLTVLSSADVPVDSRYEDVLWEALAESRALIVILAPTGPTQDAAIEVGAAWAWNKPVFGIVTDPSRVQPSTGLARVPLYPANRIADVIRAIQQGMDEFTDDDRNVLIRLYGESELTVDQLALESPRLTAFVEQFAAETRKQASGERVLAELLRLRKRGRLTRRHAGTSTRPRRGTA